MAQSGKTRPRQGPLHHSQPHQGQLHKGQPRGELGAHDTEPSSAASCSRITPSLRGAWVYSLALMLPILAIDAATIGSIVRFDRISLRAISLGIARPFAAASACEARRISSHEMSQLGWYVRPACLDAAGVIEWVPAGDERSDWAYAMCSIPPPALF